MLTNLEYGKWQPMESAPRDGALILLLIEKKITSGTSRAVEMGRYDEDKLSKKPKPYWSRLTSEYTSEMRSNQPLAWMALPSTDLPKQDDELNEPHEHTAESLLSFHCEMAGNSADEDFALGELLDMSTAELQELSQSELNEVIRPAFDDWQGTHVSGGWSIE
jgi:hypothetical protein